MVNLQHWSFFLVPFLIPGNICCVLHTLYFYLYHLLRFCRKDFLVCCKFVLLLLSVVHWSTCFLTGSVCWSCGRSVLCCKLWVKLWLSCRLILFDFEVDSVIQKLFSIRPRLVRCLKFLWSYVIELLSFLLICFTVSSICTILLHI